MTIKFNYTKRIDLTADDINAEVVWENDKYYLLLSWDLQKYLLEKNFKVFVDLRNSGTTETQRFDLGPLSSGIANHRIDISHMREPLSSRLRLKVIDINSKVHLIKAQIDNFIPRVPNSFIQQNQSKSLLKIIKDSDGECPWLLKFDSGEPTLVISGKDDFFYIVQENSSLIINLLLGDVVRQILIWLLMSNDFENDEIATKWKSFFFSLGVDPETFNNQSISELSMSPTEIYVFASQWADVFSSKHNFIRELKSELAKEIQ